MASGRYARAELLAALWKLGGNDPDERIPTSHGILDRALQNSQDLLPDLLKNNLSFGITSVGLRCYELPDLLLAAQEAELTTEPNPTYLSSMVTLEVDAARQAVVKNGLSTKRAMEIGAELRKRVAEARQLVTGASSELSAA